LKHRLHAVGIGVTILALMSSSTSLFAAVHVVKKGDTLYSIAKRNHVKVVDIKRANNLSDKKPLQIGQKLTVPSGGEAPASKQASSVKQDETRKAAVRFGRLASVQMAKADGGVCRTALSYRGARYVRGGTGRGGFDCSGFTRFVYSKHGVKLPHQSAAQSKCGVSVAKSEMKSGDLVFFNTRGGKRISHVGIYVGSGRFVHAATPGRGVIVSSLSEGYYASRFRGARRVAKSE
jgi:cell wall-associated NlpC family hydrolase